MLLSFIGSCHVIYNNVSIVTDLVTRGDKTKVVSYSYRRLDIWQGKRTMAGGD